MKAFFALAVAALPLLANALIQPSANAHRRGLKARHFSSPVARRTNPGAAIATSWDQVGDQVFDYVIAGGGTAGLALAGRLSEDPDITVAVIEAGPSGYDYDEQLLVPSNAYFKSAVGTELDWQYETVPQQKLVATNGTCGRQASWPRGKVLGGSSAINGLYYVAPGQREHQVWGRLSGDLDSWGWHNVRDAMKKSQRYSKNTVEALDKYITDQSHAMGASGPVCISYPGVSYQPVADWVPTLNAMGVESASAPYDGENQGAYIAASTIDPATWHRSFSRTAYLDPIANKRKNLVVLPNQTVTRIIWSEDYHVDRNEGRRALGLEFAASKDASRATVTARREVILSAGAIGTPQILQLSGVGNPYLLKQHNITLVKDLPGVGENLQDHLSSWVSFKPAAGMRLPAAVSGATSQQTSFVDSSIAFLTLEKIYGKNETANFIKRARQFSDDYIKSANSTPEAVKRGWKKQYDLLLDDLLVDQSKQGFNGSAKGAIEMLLSISMGEIQLATALQAPFSRGTVKIASHDAFDKPLINPNYLQHRSDVELLRSGFQVARKIGQVAPIHSLLGDEVAPGTSVQSDDEWDKWIASVVGTEYHPSSTCAMLDEEDGGVVDSELMVYGTANVRVVDASVIPLSLSAHLMSTTYAIAEIAADLIKDCAAEPIDECDYDDEDEDEDEQSQQQQQQQQQKAKDDNEDEDC
ncbi:hypothetical protein ACQY0O_007898 [Thecaphora frezii]|nr:putative GMC oxidoreductase [Thecaphora frezii]